MSDLICAWVTHYYGTQTEAQKAAGLCKTRRGASQRKFVLYTIGRSANNQGWAVEESLPSIAAAVDLPVRTVQRHIKILIDEGVLLRKERRNGGSICNLWRVLMPGVAAVFPAPKLQQSRPTNGHIPSPSEQAEALMARAAQRVFHESSP
jgi:hypothetical protein